MATCRSSQQNVERTVLWLPKPEDGARTVQVRRIAALMAVLLVPGLAVATVSVAEAEGPATAAASLAPVATDDTVTITPLIYEAEVDVLANDSDPDNGNLQVCRLDAPDDSGLSVHIWARDGTWDGGPMSSKSSFLLLEPEVKLATGTLSVTYYACDHELLTPATLTVNVVRIGVEKVVGQPGKVRFTNPLDFAVDVLWVRKSSQHVRGVTLAPHAVKTKSVQGDKIWWFAFESDPAGEGDDPLPIDGGKLTGIGGRGHPSPRVPLTAYQREAWANRFSERPRRTSPAAPAPGRDDAAVDPAEDSAPVTVADHARLDYYDGKAMRVLANDSDDAPSDLAVCRVEVPKDVGLTAFIEPWWALSDRSRSDDPDRYIDLGANAAQAGTYTLTYYACDKHRLTPGTLTVTIREFPDVEVRKVPGKPGTLVFINRGYRSVRIIYYETGHYSEKTYIDVGRHSRGRLHVAYDDLFYFAATKIGPLNYGRVKNLYPRGS